LCIYIIYIYTLHRGLMVQESRLCQLDPLPYLIVSLYTIMIYCLLKINSFCSPEAGKAPHGSRASPQDLLRFWQLPQRVSTGRVLRILQLGWLEICWVMLFAMGTDCDHHAGRSPVFYLYCSKMHDLPVSVVSGRNRGLSKNALTKSWH
jgi:hypothetical protein